MALDYVLVSFVIDLLPLGALVYLFVFMSRYKRHEDISTITQNFIHHQQHKMIRSLMIFLMVVMAFKVAALVLYAWNTNLVLLVELLQITSDVLLLVSILYLIRSYTSLFEKTIKR